MRSPRLSPIVASVLSLGWLLCAAVSAQVPDPFTDLATFTGHGSKLAEMVAPGPSGDDLYWLTYSYTGSTPDVVSIDPSTGAHSVYTLDGAEGAAWALAAGPDGNTYVGTYGDANVYRINPAERSLENLGSAGGEQNVWALVTASDGRIYGCTFPKAKLIRIDPGTGAVDDLGTLAPGQQYARRLTASSDGYVYVAVGVGQQTHQIIGYSIATGEIRDLAPGKYTDMNAEPLRGTDGNAYIRLFDGQAQVRHVFRMRGWEMESIPPRLLKVKPSNELSDRRLIEARSDRRISLSKPPTWRTEYRPYTYAGKEIKAHRVVYGPGDRLYGSTAQPAYFFGLDPSGGGIETLAHLGNQGVGGGSGEIYSFLPRSKELLMAGYVIGPPIASYRPSDPVRSKGPAALRNPRELHYRDEDLTWRPWAMIQGSDDRVFIGSQGGYGAASGALTVLKSKRGASARSAGGWSIRSYAPVVGHTVTTLAAVGELVAAGTAVAAAADDARLLLWNPATGTADLNIVPVPGAKRINDLVTLTTGKVMGLAGPSYATDLFVFDPVQRKVVYTAALPIRARAAPSHYNCIAQHRKGKVYGLSNYGVFTIDPATYEVRLEAAYPRGVVTGGFGISDDSIFFVSGPKIVRYRLPN